jgi:hypothetical protein
MSINLATIITHTLHQHEESFDSSLYCTKNETRVAGPWYVG